jgi:hypothetical protein
MPLSSVVGAQSIVRPGVCTSSTRPASPYDGQVIYMTDADQTAVWDGSSWVVLAPIASGRNVVINGAMQVAQRGTSVTGITAETYNTADRWKTVLSSLGTWTQTVENDAPTGSGFGKSLKMNCTTADASPSAGDYLTIATKLEGQNVQQFLKGTASAKQFSLSFWVKSNVTGTYIAELIDNDNTRRVSISYSVSASATWEKKTITFPADTTGVLDNDNAGSLDVNFWLGAGSTFTGGSPLQTTWGTATNTRAVGQTNLASATNNYWQVTGVQLEAGAVATPFEVEPFAETLAKCQRYYQKSYLLATNPGSVSQPGACMIPYLGTGNTPRHTIFFKVNMRAAPDVTIYNPETGTSGYMVAEGQGANNNAAAGVTFISDHTALVYTTNAPIAGHYYFQYVASKEL